MRCSRRVSCASRCTSSCCARRTRARPPWCCGAPTWPAEVGRAGDPRRRSPALAHPGPGAERVDTARRAWPTTTSLPRARSPPPPPTRKRVSARATCDVVECQDTDAARELLSCEELGLCEPGGSAALLDSGATALGGRLPVNPSGGLLSKGEPLGASALGQVVELTRQLRGECGPRQVEGARVALAHTVGRGANAGVVILTR